PTIASRSGSPAMRRTLTVLPLAILALVLAAQFRLAAPALAQRVTCASFATQAAAQAAYRANPTGLAHLDADHDGIACESNRCPCDRDPVSLQPAVSPPPEPEPEPPPEPAPEPAP